jgi:hypothetical protein
MNTNLLIAAFVYCLLAIFWDSLFHRVWSFALLCLSLSLFALYHPLLFDYNLPSWIFTILVFSLSVALSPASVILYHILCSREDDGTTYRPFEIIVDEADQTRISAEFVPPSLIMPVDLQG